MINLKPWSKVQFHSVKGLIIEAQRLSKENSEAIASCSRIKVDAEGHVILPPEDDAEKCYSDWIAVGNDLRNVFGG